MAKAFNNPLTAEHLAQINAALAKVDEAESQIQHAERAGITVFPDGTTLAAYKEAADSAKKKLLAIKQVYFPNG